MAKIISFVEGKDAAILEAAARALCLRSGGSCLYGKSCGTRARCRIEGWHAFVDDAEIVLRVIREKHVVTPKPTIARHTSRTAGKP